MIVGGETTVTLRGDGKGGRNQEMALAAAIAIGGMENVTTPVWPLMAPTAQPTLPALWQTQHRRAGTRPRAGSLGLPHRNNAYPFFEALDDLLMTGPTQTNVNDLAFILVW